MSSNLLSIGIVEDEPWAACMVKECAEALGHRVAFVALSAEETRRALAADRVQVLFLDINILGPEDGIQLARSLPGNTHRPAVIFMTAHTDRQTVAEAIGTDPVFFVAKPFGQKEIEIALSMAAAALKKPEFAPPKPKKSALSLCAQTGLPMHQGAYVPLTPKERIVAARLIASAGSAVGHGELAGLLWADPDLVNHGSLRNIITSLRKKLPACTIENILDMGYLLHLHDTDMTPNG
ncbi:MAG: response regulator [Campylobacterales bacterium]